MPQFRALLFPEDGGYRVVVEGLGGDSARSLFEAEDIARRLIERHVRASYPDRTWLELGEALGAMHFQVEIVRSDGRRERRELWLRSDHSARPHRSDRRGMVRGRRSSREK